MTTTYALTLARVRVFVSDSGSTIWADADLQEGIRLSLGEINLRSGLATPYALSGLDSAVTTTLPVNLESALVMGAGAYASMARAVDRAEAFELANEGPEVKAWSLGCMASFRALLDRLYPAEQSRTGSQKAATVPPWGSWEDDFGEVGNGYE
jgi:hypothetical protein